MGPGPPWALGLFEPSLGYFGPRDPSQGVGEASGIHLGPVWGPNGWFWAHLGPFWPLGPDSGWILDPWAWAHGDHGDHGTMGPETRDPVGGPGTQNKMSVLVRDSVSRLEGEVQRMFGKDSMCSFMPVILF